MLTLKRLQQRVGGLPPSLAEGIQQRFSCSSPELVHCTAPFVASTVWMHSLLAAPGQRARCGAMGTQAGKQQAHRHRWPSFNDHHGRQVRYWLEREIGMGRNGETARDEQRKQTQSQQDASLMILNTKMKKTGITGFSVHQNTAVCRKDWENCQINVGWGLKGTKEIL